jgi:hypothetical protein
MKKLLRTLVAVLALASALREAGAAACASACAMPVAMEMSCADACCGSCLPPADCPLFDPAPQAVVERAAAASFHPDLRQPVPPVVATLAADMASLAIGSASAAWRGIPPRSVRTESRPLWLVDRRLLI